jgi:Domain of unknown function (DUF4258)
MGMTVYTLPLTDVKALRIVREATSDSSRVLYVDHARLRMRQRGISAADVMVCLRSGRITERVHQDIRGRWKCALTGIVCGQSVTVATGFQWDAATERFLIVVTVITVF